MVSMVCPWCTVDTGMAVSMVQSGGRSLTRWSCLTDTVRRLAEPVNDTVMVAARQHGDRVGLTREWCIMAQQWHGGHGRDGRVRKRWAARWRGQTRHAQDTVVMGTVTVSLTVSLTRGRATVVLDRHGDWGFGARVHDTVEGLGARVNDTVDIGQRHTGSGHLHGLGHGGGLPIDTVTVSIDTVVNIKGHGDGGSHLTRWSVSDTVTKHVSDTVMGLPSTVVGTVVRQGTR